MCFLYPIKLISLMSWLKNCATWQRNKILEWIITFWTWISTSGSYTCKHQNERGCVRGSEQEVITDKSTGTHRAVRRLRGCPRRDLDLYPLWRCRTLWRARPHPRLRPPSAGFQVWAGGRVLYSHFQRSLHLQPCARWLAAPPHPSSPPGWGSASDPGEEETRKTMKKAVLIS